MARRLVELRDEVRALRADVRALTEAMRALRTALLQQPGGAPDAQWLTAEQVAQRLGRHVVTVRKDLRTGRLPGGVRIGGSWRMRADALEALLDAGVREQMARTEDQERVKQATDHARAVARAARAGSRSE